MGTDARPATTQRHQHNGEMVRIKMAEGGGGGQGLGEDVFTCGRVLCAIMDVVKMMITAGTKKDSLHAFQRVGRNFILESASFLYDRSVTNESLAFDRQFCSYGFAKKCLSGLFATNELLNISPYVWLTNGIPRCESSVPGWSTAFCGTSSRISSWTPVTRARAI